MICREAASYDQELVVDGAMFVAGAERGRGLVFVGGGALVVVGGTGYANNRGWQPMGGECGAGGWLARWYLWVWRCKLSSRRRRGGARSTWRR